MLRRSAYGTMVRKRRGPQIKVFQVLRIFGNHLTRGNSNPEVVNSDRKSDPMLSITEVTTALEAKGVFDRANLIDPASITTVALSLANTATPNEYMLMLSLWAIHHQVSTTALAVDVLMVLAHAGEFVGKAIAISATAQLRAMRLELVAA